MSYWTPVVSIKKITVLSGSRHNVVLLGHRLDSDLTGRIDQRTDRSGRVASPSVLRAKDPYSLALRTRKTRDSKLILRKFRRKTFRLRRRCRLPFQLAGCCWNMKMAAWLVALTSRDPEYSSLRPAQPQLNHMMYNTCNSITDD